MSSSFSKIFELFAIKFQETHTFTFPGEHGTHLTAHKILPKAFLSSCLFVRNVVYSVMHKPLCRGDAPLLLLPNSTYLAAKCDKNADTVSKIEYACIVKWI